MKRKCDEPAFEPVVDRERKRRGDVGVDGRPVAAVEQVQNPARVVDEPPPVRKVAHEIDARPAGRRDVLIQRPHAPRVRQPDEVADLDRQAAFHDRRRH